MFVFRIIPFILVLKCLVTFTSAELSTTIPVPEKPQKNIDDEKTVASNNVSKITSENKTEVAPTIIGEGGEKLPISILSNLTVIKSTTEQSDIINKENTPTAITRKYGREGELTNANNKNNSSLNVTKEKKQNVEKHHGREGEPENNSLNIAGNKSQQTATTATMSTINVKSSTEKSITVDSITTRTHDRVVPRKGVNYNESIVGESINVTNIANTTVESSTTVNNTTVQPTTTAMHKIRKPTVTTGSEDNGDALVKQKSNNSTPKVPTIEYYQKKKEDNKRSTFIIPIVAVIFSVPIVAIVINILYKRCKEWWSHRHYSRMDFLIDGMYNN